MAHVLVVEDDHANARLFELILTRVGGFSVTVTEDAAEVVERAGNGSVDLVMMDVSLSNTEYDGKFVDGIDLSRLLKAMQIAKDIPIVLTTAHALHGDRERFLKESGADEYISKPIEDNLKLVNMVNRLVNRSKAA